jgi:hypothetical protein
LSRQLWQCVKVEDEAAVVAFRVGSVQEPLVPIIV